MDYSNYPFDSQECLVQMGSAAYTDEFMVFSGSFKYRLNEQRDIQYKVIKIQHLHTFFLSFLNILTTIRGHSNLECQNSVATQLVDLDFRELLD
jgi:hypothetical protein